MIEMMNKSMMNKAVMMLALAGLAFGVIAPARADAPPVKQGTQATVRVLMQNTSGTGLTGLTVTIVIEKPGQHTFSAPTGSIIEDGNGWYELLASTTDTNTLGPLAVHATATGAVPYEKEVPVVAFDPNDAGLLGLTGVGTLANQSSLLTNQSTVLARIPGTVQPQTGDAFALMNPLVSAGKYTALALSLAPTGAAPTVSQIAAGILRTPANLLTTDAVGWVAVNNFPATVVASNLPTDYQQRGLPVTLPTTAPTGYGGTSGTAQTGDAFALLNPLVSAGKYTALALSLAPSGGGGVTDSTVTADVIAALTAQGYTVTRGAKLDNLDATVSGVSARLLAYTLAGTTFGDHIINSSAVTWGNSTPTYSGLIQTSPFALGGTTFVTSTLTRNSSGQTVSRTGVLANQ